MSKQQVIEQFTKAGVEVRRVIVWGNTFKVTINWRDYMKIRDNHAFRGYKLVLR